ncbi:sulfur-oxidizing protein [Thiorhodovibrio winogradskyi]|uniref:Sulfur-oxidizing protein n=1 Tax=Thiorhodovibrio winogradskyi TaxID=77007 RepID=A0ABZ0S204_9GAMM|nr:thiosulfate oxidation carrier complex protein SoxZ [Thiorhodovibrio winogradskyi]
MASSIRIRAKLENGVTTVKTLMTHPMETGLRKDEETDETIPAHFIQEVTGKWRDQVVMKGQWSGGVSKNPYLSFQFKGGEPGDAIEISWMDSQGNSDSATTKIAD